MRVILFLALKDMIRDKKIVLLVISMLAFSYINLTFFPAFLNGLSNTFQNEIINTGTSHIYIQPNTESGRPYIPLESSIRKKIDLIPGVVGSSGVISFAGTASAKGKQMGARVEAIDPSEDDSVTTIREKLVKGDYLSPSNNDEILVGEIIAGRKIEDLIGKQTFGLTVEGLGGVDVGDSVTIAFPNGVKKEYRVKGIVSSFGFGFVSQSIYMSKQEVQNILGIEDQVSFIRVRLNNKNEAERYKNLILELGIPSVTIRTWAEASSFIEGITQTFNAVILVTTLVGIIIVMATIGIVVFINTARKRRIIGVLRAIGMQQDQIMMIFLIESLIFGIIGILIGNIIVYSTLFYFKSNPIILPLGKMIPVLPVETAINSIIILLISSVAAGYIPARMASRQDVLETIRVVE